MHCQLFALAFLALTSIASAAPRNIVLVVADDMGRTAGCYGDEVARTPHLDRLAREGTRFEFAFCTTASCSPSRSVLLTGLQNHANGQYGLQHAEHNFSTKRNVKGLPLLLEAAGYRTCAIGKIHVQPEEVYRFGTYLSGVNSRSTVEMAERCREFVAADKERPFFLYFCPTDPHRAVKGFANEADYSGVERVVFDPAKIVVPDFLPDLPETRRELAEYYQSVARLDQGVGKLVEVLKETGQWENTLFVFLSDNGIPFPGAKTTLYEPGTRLPLIVRAPGQESPGGCCNALVTWADVTPTILEFAGVKPPKLHGRSFLGILDEQDPQGWDTAFASHSFHEVTMYYPMRAIRTRQYKYIHNLAHPLPFPFASDLYESATWQSALEDRLTRYGQRSVQDFLHRPQHELYDLEADPGEARNLAADPQRAATLADLQQQLRQWRHDTADPWTIKDVHE